MAVGGSVVNTARAMGFSRDLMDLLRFRISGNGLRLVDDDLDWEPVVDEITAAIVVVFRRLGAAFGIRGARHQHDFTGSRGHRPIVIPEPPGIAQ